MVVLKAVARVEIAQKTIADRLYKLHTSADAVMLNLFPLGDVHRVLDDGTKVWLSEAERFYPR